MRSGRSSGTRSPPRRRLVAVLARHVAPVDVDHPRHHLHRVPGTPADHDAAPHLHLAAEHVPGGQGPPEGRDAADAEPGGDRARELRRLDDRGLHLEAVARTRCVHDVRPLHQRVPCACDRQAARPPRDRAEGGRGHGRDRHAGRQPADRDRPRDHDHGQLAVRAHHARGDLGLHDLQGVRRDLPGEHRDHRQDLRHAAVPVADGVELPRRARQRLPRDGEPAEPVGHEPG